MHDCSAQHSTQWGVVDNRYTTADVPPSPSTPPHPVPDKCQAAHDVRGAQQAMALASTFFREQQPTNGKSSEKEREYLLPVVRAHPMWQDRRLWEDSLMLSVADQLELCPQVIYIYVQLTYLRVCVCLCVCVEKAMGSFGGDVC